MNPGTDIAQELKEVAPALPVAVRTPYKVPAGYFESFPELVLFRIRTQDIESVRDELKILSPVLSGLRKEMPYTVPEGYFENIRIPVNSGKSEPAKVIRLQERSVFKYAAAAATIIFISLVAIFFMNRPGDTGQALVVSEVNADEQVQEKIDKVSESEMAEFVEGSSIIGYLDNNTPAGELVEADIQLLLSDVTEQELEQYLKMNTPERQTFN